MNLCVPQAPDAAFFPGLTLNPQAAQRENLPAGKGKSALVLSVAGE